MSTTYCVDAAITAAPDLCNLTLLEMSMLNRLATAGNRVLTYAWFATAFANLGVTVARARTRLAHLEKLDLLRSCVVGRGEQTEGKRYRLTERGERLVGSMHAAAATTTECEPASDKTSAPRNIYALISEKGRAQLAACLPTGVHALLVDRLSRGEHPDWETIEPLLGAALARDVHAFIERKLSEPMETPVRAQSHSEETLRPAPTEAQIESLKLRGIVVPDVVASSPEGEGVAEAARLFIMEAAVRAPQLLARGNLRRVLPEVLWAILRGPVADYGPLLKRVRCALRWIMGGRWTTPKGFKPAEAAPLMMAFRLCGTPA